MDFDLKRMIPTVIVAGVVTSLVAIVINYGLEFIGGLGFFPDALLGPLALVIVGAVGMVGFGLYQGTQTLEDLPEALMVLAVVTGLSTIEGLPVVLDASVFGSLSGSVSTLVSLVLLLSYTFLGMGITNRYVPMVGKGE